MTIHYPGVAGLIGGFTAYGLTDSLPLFLIVAFLSMSIWMYSPLPRSNGSLGGPTGRYWGFSDGE